MQRYIVSLSTCRDTKYHSPHMKIQHITVLTQTQTEYDCSHTEIHLYYCPHTEIHLNYCPHTEIHLNHSPHTGIHCITFHMQRHTVHTHRYNCIIVHTQRNNVSLFTHIDTLHQCPHTHRFIVSLFTQGKRQMSKIWQYPQK